MTPKQYSDLIEKLSNKQLFFHNNRRVIRFDNDESIIEKYNGLYINAETYNLSSFQRDFILRIVDNNLPFNKKAIPNLTGHVIYNAETEEIELTYETHIRVNNTVTYCTEMSFIIPKPMYVEPYSITMHYTSCDFKKRIKLIKNNIVKKILRDWRSNSLVYFKSKIFCPLLKQVMSHVSLDFIKEQIKHSNINLLRLHFSIENNRISLKLEGTDNAIMLDNKIRNIHVPLQWYSSFNQDIYDKKTIQ